MSMIHISKEDFEKLKNSPKSKELAILVSKFSPERKEKLSIKGNTKKSKTIANKQSKTSKIHNKDLALYKRGQISLEEYNKRKTDKMIADLSETMRKIRVKKGLEKPKEKDIKRIHVHGPGLSNRSVFRADDKNIWPYKK